VGQFSDGINSSTSADLPARARAVIDPEERRAVLSRILARLERSAELDDWLARSPLVAVLFDEP